MKFGREVMQMLLGGKKVASIALMPGYDDAYLALDAEDVLTCYYREYGVGKSSEWLSNGWRELPTDSKEQKLRDTLEEIATLASPGSGDLKPGYVGRDLTIDTDGFLHPAKPEALLSLLNSINTIANRGLE